MFTSKELLPAPTQASSSSSKYRLRKKRVIPFGLLLFVVGIIFFAPPSFWELHEGLGRASNRYSPDFVADKTLDQGRVGTGIVDINDPNSVTTPLSPTVELKLLLHMVASTELHIPKDVDPTKPLDRLVYNAGIGSGIGGGIAWLQAQQIVPPVIVFSKTYCPYSKRAKQTLKTFNLSPPEKIIEVDKRDDGDLLKAILTRLTGHSTFPNIFIQGRSIGGSDDLQSLVEKDQLVPLFSKAGASFKESNPNGD